MDLLFILFVIGYLVGSIPFGLILAKLAGYGDIRKIGSGNIGATNVLRTGNKTLALFTLLLDSAKAGLFVFLLTSSLVLDFDYFFHAPIKHAAALTIGLGGIIGHCYPVWLKFKGGKGVATMFGVLLAATPWTGFIAAVTWGIVAGFTRYSSLSALCAVAIAPIVTLIYYGVMPAVITVLITALVFWRHKENIQRLRDGSESKIGASKKDTDESPAEKN